MVDLGLSPRCQHFLKKSELRQPEVFYPLEALVCEKCWLVQVDDFDSNQDIFNEEYGYFSSFSTSWLEHARSYCEMIVHRLHLDGHSFVVEVASNDGYLLKNFVAAGIPCLGIDPSANVAAAAAEHNVETRVEFFTDALAKELSAAGKQADLIIGNNVLAHTPYIMDFIAGVATLLKPTGMATFEFPHLLRLIDEVQFDTIYHEHYSYYSLSTVQSMFLSVGLDVVDVEEISSAGGSLRIFLKKSESQSNVSESVNTIIANESSAGLQSIQTYLDFGLKAARVKDELLTLLLRLKAEGKKVVGYGAPGKGNTLLNYCGIKPDLLPFTCDRGTHRHGRYCPGSRIPVFAPVHIDNVKPDYILILPWNLQREITEQLAHVREWGCKFIVPIPIATILD